MGLCKPVEGHEPVDIVPHRFIVGVEDMRTVAMDVDALHLFGVDIAGDVRPLVDDEDGFAGGFCLLGEDGAEEAGADDEIVVHLFSLQYMDYEHCSKVLNSSLFEFALFNEMAICPILST